MMFCPYCKMELETRNDEFYCRNGDCYFSKYLTSYFTNKVACQIPLIENQDEPRELKNGKFYCVYCGDKMKIIGELEEACLKCRFMINRSIYHQIVELNPHR